jgi:hypothetical protein
MLVRVLDGLRQEAAGTKHAARYAIGSTRDEDVWQARARAYIHLYLKVMFGITSFEGRENYVTDGTGDGGIDGYYVDQSGKIIYILQSKFRQNEENFESKPIELKELLSMQIKRILGGHDLDEQGCRYNGKILGLQRGINEIFNIGLFSYKVIILANLRHVSQSELQRLTDNIDAEVIDYQVAYSKLLYPVLAGTLFKATGLGISIDLSNKSTGAKISYSVSAEDVECEITVVFVPTIEIARIMSMYKNSILMYNPRSYLEFEGEKVNGAIRRSITKTKGNDFALLNNGITIICDESGVNEQSGKKNKAQLFLLNPQIINGGQTAYTLSRIYEDTTPEDRELVFAGKEVMVKAIAVESSGEVGDDMRRISLIEKISDATNSQTVVTTADRASGDPRSSELQNVLFTRYGLLFEGKRGEFGEGLRQKYIHQDDIINRTTFARLYLAANGTLLQSLQRKLSINSLPRNVAENSEKLDQFAIAKSAFDQLRKAQSPTSQLGNAAILPLVRAAVICANSLNGMPKEKGGIAAELVKRNWFKFLERGAAISADYVRLVVDPVAQKQWPELRSSRRMLRSTFERDVEQFFSVLTT